MILKPNSNIYLAARHSLKNDLLRYREQLVAAGHTVTSRWLDGDYPVGEDGLSLEADPEVREMVASQDLCDIIRSDVLITFTEEPRSRPSRGGFHVEFGFALALSKKIIIIGPRMNVFHCFGVIRCYPDWGSFAAETK